MKNIKQYIIGAIIALGLLTLVFSFIPDPKQEVADEVTYPWER